jgi:TRAP-type C4-dicarboxylate transport system substrate-binding protein
MLTRRHVLVSALAAPAILRLGTGTAQAATTLKISHQFPGGTIDKGDFRDRMCRMFAAEVAKRSGGDIAAEIYPNSSLIKTNAQFSAMRKGALDISLYPMPYAGGELPETNIGLMPGLVSTYDQGLSWKKKPVGKALSDFLADKGIILLTWVWQAGGVASRSRPIVAPEDAKGLKVRGGSREMDMVLQAAGASVLSVPSNEIYAAMQTGACDAGITSSTSLISFRLGRGRILLVHAGTADDVEVDFGRLAEKTSGHHPRGRCRTGSVWQERRAGRRHRGCQGLPEGRLQDRRA